MNDAQRIIVVGAGPVGLIAALRLVEAGIPVTVLEQASEVSRDLRASTFHPPTLDMLAPSGLTDVLLAHGLVCPTWQVRIHPSGARAEFDLSALAAETAHPYRLQCEQSRLCEALEQRLRAEPLADLRFDTTLLDLRQDERQVIVTVTHADGTEAAPLAAAVVIGADGAGSRVRECIGLEFEGSTYPETTVLVSTAFAFHEHIDGLANVSYCWSDTGNFSLLRLKDFWRCSLAYEPGLPFVEAVSERRLQAQLQAIVPNAERFEIIDRRPYRVHQRIVADYRVGRVVLAGDAAHLNSPSGGMGMNGGIHDAFNLCEKLVDVWNGADLDLLDRYTRQRRPVAESEILGQADRNRRRMALQEPAARRAALTELQRTADDPVKCKAYLLQASMFTALRAAAAVD